MKKRIPYLILTAWLVGLAMLTGGCGQKGLMLETASSKETIVPSEAAPRETTAAMIYVHVCGEVASPGVYEAPAGSRYQQLVDLAGGMTENAARDYLNMAKIAADGEKIVVPSKEEAENPFGLEETAPGDDRINLNTATKTELMTLPGIGESKAAAIIAYRESNGSFQTPEDVMKVAGIKEAAFLKMKEYIRVE